MSNRLKIGTRGSKLALVQAEYVAALLRQAHPGLHVELQIIFTKGDRVLDVALSAVGGKGLFVKELETALLAGEVDLAVHSCKDLPSVLPASLTLAAFPERVEPRDALVLPVGEWQNKEQQNKERQNKEQQNKEQRAESGDVDTRRLVHDSSLGTLPSGARVGTSSPRRACQLRALRPDLQVLDVRGNVDSRLRKLDEGQYDALVLAAAGLLRLGLGKRISQLLPPETMLPAVAQGALAIEARADDPATLSILAALDHPPTHTTVLAERAFLRRMEGGCQLPIAAFAELRGENGALETASPQQRLYLRGLVGALDGSLLFQSERLGSINEPEALGMALAEELIERGAATLLEA